MGFMKQQITRKLDWYQVDTPSDGIVSVPCEDTSLWNFATDCDVSENSVSVVSGYGARMSAPGYIDCTDWAVFNSVEKAQEYLTDYFGDDDEETDPKDRNHFL